VSIFLTQIGDFAMRVYKPLAILFMAFFASAAFAADDLLTKISFTLDKPAIYFYLLLVMTIYRLEPYNFFMYKPLQAGFCPVFSISHLKRR